MSDDPFEIILDSVSSAQIASRRRSHSSSIPTKGPTMHWNQEHPSRHLPTNTPLGSSHTFARSHCREIDLIHGKAECSRRRSRHVTILLILMLKRETVKETLFSNDTIVQWIFLRYERQEKVSSGYVGSTCLVGGTLQSALWLACSECLHGQQHHGAVCSIIRDLSWVTNPLEGLVG